MLLDTVYDLEVSFVGKRSMYGSTKTKNKTVTYANKKECYYLKDSMVKELKDRGYDVEEHSMSADCYDKNTGSSIHINIYPRLATV